MDRVSIKTESYTEWEENMMDVLRTSEFQVMEDLYCYKNVEHDSVRVDNNVLAFVRDSEHWSCLILADSDSQEDNEKYKLFCFHFKQDKDNSGFVGWLATKIKKKFGSGVFVVCGFNSDHGGIYDYWGCPIEIGQKVVNYIETFRDALK